MTRFVPLLFMLSACTSSKGWLELGVLEDRFDTIDDNQPIQLVYGPQGGYHIWLSALSHGVGSPVQLDLSIVDSAGVRLEWQNVRVSLEPTQFPDVKLIRGLPFYVAHPEAFAGTPCVLEASAVDESGAMVSIARHVVPHMP